VGQYVDLGVKVEITTIQSCAQRVAWYGAYYVDSTTCVRPSSGSQLGRVSKTVG